MKLSILVVFIVVLSTAQKGIALSFGVLLRGRLWEQKKRIHMMFPQLPPSYLHSKYPSILGINSCRDSNIVMLQESINDDEYGEDEAEENESQTIQNFCYNPQIASSMNKYSTGANNRSYFWFFIIDILIPIILGVLSYLTASMMHLSDRFSTYLNHYYISGEKTKKQRFESPEEYDKYLEEILLNADSLNALYEYDQARQMIEEAVTATYVTHFSKQHDPGTLYHMLSTIESSAGNNVAALNAINNAYEIYENALGPSIETAYLLEDLSTILTTLGRFDDAKAALQKSKLYLETCNESKEVNDSDKHLLEKELIEYKLMLMERAKTMAATEKFSDDEDECSDQDSELEMFNKPYVIPPIVHNATQKREIARIMNQLGGIEYMSGDFLVAADSYAKSKEMFMETKDSLSTIEVVDQNLKASKAASILTASEFIEMCKSIEDESNASTTNSATSVSSELSTTERENTNNKFENSNNDESLDHSEIVVIDQKEDNKGKRISPVGVANDDIY